MYVCVCNAVTERDIARAYAEGARHLRDLRASLGVTSECGRCARCAHACLRELDTAAQAPAVIHLHRSKKHHEGRPEGLAAA